ncbi:MAG: ATP-binding protein [Bacteroidales bacterium]|nr:ATP-binding protein [Bacteroidales bacterium]
MKSKGVLIISLLSLFVAVASFLTIPFSSQILTKWLASPPQIDRAASVLKQRTDAGIEVAKELVNASIDKGFVEPFEMLSESTAKRLDDEGISIFIFNNDSLIFWSEALDIDRVAEYSDRLVKVQNVWCTSYWIAHDSIKALALVKVKYSYPYQNKFLENSFHPSLSFLDDYEVAPEYYPGSFPVSLYSSVPVIYLTYIPKDFAKQHENFKALLSWIGFLCLLLAVFLFFCHPRIRRNALPMLLPLAIVLFGLRLVSLFWDIIPKGQWLLFKPEVFAYSWLAPSVGDLLLNTIILFAIIAYAFRPIISLAKNSNRRVRVIGVLLSIISLWLFLISESLIAILVQNSTITLEAFKIFNLSVFSLLEYLILSLWFVSASLLLIAARYLLNSLPKKRLFVLWVLIIVLLGIGSFITGETWGFSTLILLLALCVLFLYYKPHTKFIHSSLFLIFVSIISAFSVWNVSVNASHKDNEIRKLLAINLANERDPIAEVNFPQLARKMHVDGTIREFLDRIEDDEDSLNEYVQENYLSGYLNKYDFQITVCLSASQLHIENSGDVVYCFGFFEDMLNEYGQRIPGSSFYHLNNQNGRISYLGIVEFVLHDGAEACIYIELDSKLNKELLGYPELLIDRAINIKRQVSEYSSAKYFDNELIAFTGSYNFPLYNIHHPDSTSRYTFINTNGYNHMLYKDEGRTTIILSKPNVSILNVTASFAWVFLFFYFTLIAWFTLGGLVNLSQSSIPSFKNRIKFTMVLVLFLSLILVGTVTIAFSVKSFEQKNLDNLNEKLVSVMVDVENNLLPHDILYPEYNHYLTTYLIELSNVFHSDINLYDTNGALLVTSRPEVFERNLFGRQMNPLAWFELDNNHAAKLIHSESIGNMNYLSAYAPLVDQSNQKVGYLNLPYFTRQGEFMKEVLLVIVALVNIYAFLILLSILIAVFISNKIAKPLELIRQRIGTIDIAKHIETIDYQGKDEVGQLVSEYNRMVVELAESAKKLAQSQRQSAWREMAKQIAHEIKNPLTPIKLNLQLLVKAKKEGHSDWSSLFDRFASSLNEQISTLSNIATEFSNFAQMPVGQFGVVDLVEVINDVVILFSAYPNIRVETEINFDGQAFVYADKEQLQRVFVNLLKNAVQAIGKDDNGLIAILLDRQNDWIEITVTDNGMGIPLELEEKLFSPNFTTKSGGMGLGLAISKSIVEVIGGKIWFETKHEKGTKFFVNLPLVRN